MPKKISEDFDDEINDYEPQKADGETIVKSLESIKYQTSRHLSINTGLPDGVILDWLETFNLTGEILSEMVGSNSAYFLPDNKPKGKLFLGGDNSVHIRLEEKPAHTSTRKIGEVVTAAELPKADERYGRKPKASPEPAIIQPTISPDDVEKFAAINPKQRAVAAALGVNYTAIYTALQTNTEVYKAFERGKIKYMKNQELKNKLGETETVNPAAAPKPQTPEKISSTAEIRQILTTEIVESAAFNRLSTHKLAEQYNITSGKRVDAVLYSKVKGGDSDLLAAWKRGKQRLLKLDHAKEIVSETPKTVDDPETVEKFVAAREKTEILTPEKIDVKNNERIDERNGATDVDVNPRFAHQLEHISRNGLSKTSIEDKKAEFLESLPKIPARAFPIPQQKETDLQIGFTGDFFRLPESKRIMLLQMAKIKDAFESDEA